MRFRLLLYLSTSVLVASSASHASAVGRCVDIFKAQGTSNLVSAPRDYRDQELYDWVNRAFTDQRVESPLKKSWRRLNLLISLTPPDRADKMIPAELLTKISRDGIETHLSEIAAAYRKTSQANVELYRRARKLYKYLVLAGSLHLGVAHIEAQIDQSQAQSKSELVASVRNMDQGLDQIERLLDQGAFDN